MKNTLFFPFMICLLASWLGSFSELQGVCVQSDADTKEVTNEIEKIEAGLGPAIQIKGDSPVHWSVNDRMEHYQVPGVSIAVVKDGKIRWVKGYGVANSEQKTEVTADTLFQAGSISKPIAALAALQLVDQGKIGLDDDVNQHLNDWKVPDNRFTENEKVTLRRLLTHTAGMTVHGFPGYPRGKEIPETVQVLDGKGNTGPIRVDTQPGSLWRYSGGGYTVMQKLVEDVSGLPFDEYLQENVLLPLGMRKSSYEQPLPTIKHSNVSAAYDRSGKIIEGWWHNYPEQAAAGLWTTPSDLAAYCIEIQQIVDGKKDGILSSEIASQMLEKHKGDWGLGPSLDGEGEELIFQHGGKNAGFTNNMFAYAHRGNAVIVMTNGDNGSPLIDEIMRAIADEYDWKGKSRWVELADSTQEKMEKFAGTYQVEMNGRNITIQIEAENDGLKVDIPMQRAQKKILPIGKLEFCDVSDGTEILFSAAEDGTIEALTINGQIKLTKSK